MKQHRNLLWALAILIISACGLWAWKRKMSASPNPPDAPARLPLPSQATIPQQGPVARPQVAGTPDAGGVPVRRFIDMTARERGEMLRQIKATDADELLKLFLDAGRIDQDPMKQSMLQIKLVGALMEKRYTPDFIERMKRFVMDAANSKIERGLVISAFAGARTKEGAEFILWVVANQTDMEVRAGAVSNIRGLGGSHPYLPAMIEPLWKESNDADLLTAVAEAMAREGAPSSIELLLPAAAAPDGHDDKRRWAAIWAIPKIYRSDAVPALESAMINNPPGSKMNGIALSTLGQIGDKSAGQAVIVWLQNADKGAAPLVADWIGRASGSGHLPAAEAALNPSVPFRSEENREAIRAALAALRAATIKIGPNGKWIGNTLATLLPTPEGLELGITRLPLTPVGLTMSTGSVSSWLEYFAGGGRSHAEEYRMHLADSACLPSGGPGHRAGGAEHIAASCPRRISVPVQVRRFLLHA